MAVENILMSSDRLTDTERERIKARLCTHQTGVGLPHIEYCPAELTSAEWMRGSIECRAHENDAASDGHPVLRLPQFDMYGTEPPAGDWAYEVDDFGITYNSPGWWPFKRANDNGTSVRLAPDVKYRAGRNHYVLVYPGTDVGPVVTASLYLFAGKRGMGADVISTFVKINLKTHGITLPGSIPAELHEQAQGTAARVLSFLLAARKERRQGKPAPITAYDRHAASQAVAGLTAH